MTLFNSVINEGPVRCCNPSKEITGESEKSTNLFPVIPSSVTMPQYHS